MNRSLFLLTSLAGAAGLNAQITVLNDIAPTITDWFYVANASTGSGGHNLNPSLSTNTNGLNFSIDNYTNNTGSQDNLLDNNYVMRNIPAVTLNTPGQRATVRFQITNDGGSSKLSVARGAGVRLIASNGNTLPSSNTLYGTAGTSVVPDGQDFEFTGGAGALDDERSMHLAANFTIGNTQATLGGNVATDVNNSEFLYNTSSGVSGGGNVNMGASFNNGGFVEYEITFNGTQPTSNTNQGYSETAVFGVTLTYYDTDGSSILATTSDTITGFNAHAFEPGGITFNGLAIGTTAFGQLNDGSTRGIDFTIDDIIVTTTGIAIPEPSTYALFGGMLAGLLVWFRSQRR